MSARVTVLKFGSSVLRTSADLPTAVHAVYAEVRRGRRVVAVVSAAAGATDDLLARATSVCDPPREDAAAALLSTGERATAALLTMALDRAGIPAVLREPADIGLVARGPRLSATPEGLDVDALTAAWRRHAVVVVPGFFAMHGDGGTALLGRGGTDATALFLAQRLGAACRLVKDVDGVYDGDPAAGSPARRYRELSFDDAVALGARVVQPRAMAFARTHGLRFRVGAWWRSDGTRVGAPATRHGGADHAGPMRVALLGLGSVGAGVWRLLARHPALFQVAGVAVRDGERHVRAGFPRALLCDDARKVAAMDVDVVVELMGGLDPAGAIVAGALESGRHVVTANKALLAERGVALERVARERGTRLSYAAAVGGAVPMLEMVRRVARGAGVSRLDAVLNGTANFVLDRMALGAPLADAVVEAQRRGFAEADPSLDLDGGDAAQKLALLARAAWGTDADWRRIERQGIRGGLPSPRRGGVVRLVATAVRVGPGCELSVRPLVVSASHPLGRVRDEENAIVVTRADGTRLSRSGRGAGRWPTSEAVFADLLDLARAGSAAPEPAAC